MPKKTDAERRIAKAVELAAENAMTDGAHHKQWVIDQMLRALLGDCYDDWRDQYETEASSNDCFGEWDEGIAP